MSKIHINSNGEPGVCRAVSKPCPFGSDDTHFSSVAEAEEAYSKAQELIGNSTFGKSKLGNNGERVLTFASEEEALKIANLLKNEGKTAAVSIITVKHALNKPKREDYETDEDFESDDEHFWELSRQEVGEFTEDPLIYQLRSFDSQDAAQEGVYSTDWNDKDLVPPSEDLKELRKEIEEEPEAWKDIPETSMKQLLGLHSESLFVDRRNPYTVEHNGHEAFVSKINYDQEGAVLKEAKVYFIPDIYDE